MATEMILDVVVILLLVPTIVYAIILNRRLTALRRSREELSKVVNSFNEATMRAEAGIPKLKKATTEANHTLKDRVEKAQTLRDDLAFMIERAEELAARLEGAVRAARTEGAAVHGPAAAPTSAAPRPLTETAAPARTYGVAAAPSSLSAATLAQTAAGFEETAAELRNALGAARAEARAAEARTAVPQGMVAAGLAAAAPARGGSTYESNVPPPRPKRGDRPYVDPVEEERSEAERELLKALQSAR